MKNVRLNAGEGAQQSAARFIELSPPECPYLQGQKLPNCTPPRHNFELEMTGMKRVARTRGGLLTVGGLDLSPVAFPRYDSHVDRVRQSRGCCVSELSPHFRQPAEAGLQINHLWRSRGV